MYFLYICIHTLTSRSQLPPFLSWFGYLNILWTHHVYSQITTYKARRRMASEHRSRLSPDLFPSNLSLSVHMLVYVHPRSAVAPPTNARENRIKFWHSSPVLTQFALDLWYEWGGLYMLLDLCPCLAGSFEHSSHICVKFFGIQVP